MIVMHGPVFWILVLLAAVAVVVYFMRMIELRRAQIDYQDFLKGVTNVLGSGNDEEALSICEDTLAPVAQVVITAIQHRHGSERILRESVDSKGRAEIGRLERRLATLAIIAQIAPAIGLLGTIIGFIKAMMLANGEELVSRADLVGASVEALVSAALGLAIAIPVVVMYGSLKVRLDRFVSELEAAATMIVGYITSKEGTSV